jgi:hypothetical protein
VGPSDPTYTLHTFSNNSSDAERNYGSHVEGPRAVSAAFYNKLAGLDKGSKCCVGCVVLDKGEPINECSAKQLVRRRAEGGRFES